MNRSRRALSLGLAVLALSASACATRVEVSDRDPDVVTLEPVPAPPLPPAPGGADQPPDQTAGDGEAVQVEPHPDVQGSSATPWDRVSFDREGQSLTVYWTSGVEPCTVLDRIEVQFFDDEVVVTVLEGSPPEAATISCVAMAQAKKFTVDLEEDPGDRHFTDGAG